MRALLVCLILFVGQQNTLQDRIVVHLRPNGNTIENDFGEKLLELINAPTLISLPTSPRRLDSQGNPWSIEVKNLGPSAVTVAGKGQFSSRINVGGTVHITWNSLVYSLKR